MKRVLFVITVAVWAGAISIRSIDPVLPQLADDIGISIHRAVLLSTAFALPYALMQPILGACADVFGKARLITVCLFTLVGAALVGGLASDFYVLLASRIVGGIATGGIFPICLALAGDLVPVRDRQVAVGRMMAGALTGIILGSAAAGVIGDFLGWRGVFFIITTLTGAAAITALLGFRGVTPPRGPRPDLATLIGGYREILANPNAPICYGAVFIEGVCVFGLFPYVAALLVERGEPRLSMAGAVIAGFAIGGLIYALIVGRILPLLGERKLMAIGTLLCTPFLLLAAFDQPWQLMFASFVVMGVGFYSLHGCLQIYVTELSSEARASATALHSGCFFLGHATGPVVYGLGISYVGLFATLASVAAVMTVAGLVCARFLRRHEIGVKPSGLLPEA